MTHPNVDYHRRVEHANNEIDLPTGSAVNARINEEALESDEGGRVERVELSLKFWLLPRDKQTVESRVDDTINSETRFRSWR